MRPPRTIRVTRYVTPLREGGSLPAIVEADDDGMYVLKFRGAGQGPKALIAELVAGEIGRALGLPVPEIVFAELDPDLARTEPDPEIHALIHDSGGLNLAVDYLPGSVMFDPIVDAPDARLASRIVWFDALMTNVDRTVRNPNMLMWHRRLWLIDHGASLYFHHASHWEEDRARAEAAVRHVERPPAGETRHDAGRGRRGDGGGADTGGDRRRGRPRARVVAAGPRRHRRTRRLPRGVPALPARSRSRRLVPSSRSRPVPGDASTGTSSKPEYTYDYAVIRVVPRVERGESINVGVIVSCPDVSFLDARIELDIPRLLALDETLDVRRDPDQPGHDPGDLPRRRGRRPIGTLPQRNRFHWLVSPRSTVIQPSPVHTGRTSDPAAALERLLERMVRRPSAPGPTGERAV